MSKMLLTVFIVLTGCAMGKVAANADEQAPKQESASTISKDDSNKIESSGLMKVFGSHSYSEKNEVMVTVDLSASPNQKATYNLSEEELKELGMPSLLQDVESCRYKVAKDKVFVGRLVLNFSKDKLGHAKSLKSKNILVGKDTNKNIFKNFGTCVAKELTEKISKK